MASVVPCSGLCSTRRLAISGLPSLSRFPPKLLRNRLDHEAHERDVVCHAVQLEAPVKALRDAGRQLRPGFVGLRHQAALFFDPGGTGTAPTASPPPNLNEISGAEGSRTPDLYSAILALSQLSYG